VKNWWEEGKNIREELKEIKTEERDCVHIIKCLVGRQEEERSQMQSQHIIFISLI
jgi:hypothetical protein